MDTSFADAFTQSPVIATALPIAGTGIYENIGRFCPMQMAINPTTTAATDYYSWARNLFTYLTVTAPSDDYMPNVDPGINDITTHSDPAVLTAQALPIFKYPPGPPSPVLQRRSHARKSDKR